MLLALGERREPLGSAVTRAIRRANEAILATWPYTKERPDKLALWLTTGEKFYLKFFARKLGEQVSEDTNNGMANSDAMKLRERLEVRSVFGPSCSILLILHVRMI
jgi:hypothetical protein